jgi:ubiquitin C-terminal hydrolase
MDSGKTKDISYATGILNDGNKCYFISIMQALASCPSIYYILKKYTEYSKSILKIIQKYNLLNMNNEEIINKCKVLLISNEDEEEITVLNKIIKNTLNIYIFVDWFLIINQLMFNSGGNISILGLIQKLRIIVEKQGLGDLFSGEQCDSNESLIFLLDTLHQSCSTQLDTLPSLSIEGLPEIIKKQYHDMYIQHFGKQHSKFINEFQNIYLSIIKCKICNHNVINISPMNVINIPIPVPSTTTPYADLHMCMANYFQVENLDGYICENCKNLNSCYLKKQFLELANTLIIVFKRFIQLPNGNIVKNNIDIKFPEILLMNDFIIQGMDKQQETKKNCYLLTSAVCHISRIIGGGHYVSFIRKLKDKNWYYCNDENVSACVLNDVLSQGNTGILFYSKIN